jgi:signal transduction histidine kinase
MLRRIRRRFFDLNRYLNIKTRAALVFTLIVSLLIGTFALSIYLFSKETEEKIFYERLAERAGTTAMMILEKDELDSVAFQKVKQIFHVGITNEIIQVFDSHGNRVFLKSDRKAQPPSKEILHAIQQKGIFQSVSNENFKYGLAYQDNQGNFVIFIDAPDEYGFLKIQRLKYLLISITLIAVLITATAGWFFARHILRPLDKILDDLDKITIHNLYSRIESPSNASEIDHLVKNTNSLLARLESSFQAQKSFISNVSHEIRTPLSIILGELEIASASQDEEKRQRHLDSFKHEVKRLARLTEQLLWLAHSFRDKQDIYFSKVRIDEVIFEAVKLTNASARVHRKVEVIFGFEPNDDSELTVTGNSDLLKALSINLIENGMKYSPADKPVNIVMESLGESLRINFIDFGEGILPSDIPHIFEPFYRGTNKNQQSKGYGIGLHLCKQIADIHDASLYIVYSSVDKGTMVGFEIKNS